MAGYLPCSVGGNVASEDCRHRRVRVFVHDLDLQLRAFRVGRLAGLMVRQRPIAWQRRRLELEAVPNDEVATIDDTVRIEIAIAPGRRVGEFILIPDDKIGSIDKAVQVGVTAKVRIA